MTPSPDDSRYLDRQEAAQLKHDFLTNDIVKLRGRQAPRVNGRPLKLSTHGQTLLLLLAARAVKYPGDYFTAEDLVLAIERGRRILGDLRLSWDRPTPGHVYSAISNVRAALQKRKLNEALVERVTGKGYRLSTPAMNVVIAVPGAELLARLAPRPHDRWERG